MNDQNLIPNTERTPSEIKENCTKAGIASGVARRKRKMIADITRAILNDPASSGSDKTRIEVIVAKMVTQVYNEPTPDNVLKLQKIVGEDVTNINLGSAELESLAAKFQLPEIKFERTK